MYIINVEEQYIIVICNIYVYYVLYGIGSFEIEFLDMQEMFN